MKFFVVVLAALALTGAAQAAEVRTVVLAPSEDVSLPFWCDGTCIAPRKTSRACDGRGFDFGVHPIFTQRWSAEREVEYGPQIGTASLPAPALPQWVVWDITDLVGDWAAGGLENDGILLELVDGQEDYGTSGPLFPSSSYPNVSLRPRLTVWYVA